MPCIHPQHASTASIKHPSAASIKLRRAALEPPTTPRSQRAAASLPPSLALALSSVGTSSHAEAGAGAGEDTRQSKARAGRPGERRQTAGPESLRCRCLRLPAPLRPRSCVVVRVSGQWPACQSWGEERAAQGSRQRQRATRGSGLGRLQKSSCIRPAALPQVSASTQAQRAGVGHGGRERPTRVRPESK